MKGRLNRTPDFVFYPVAIDSMSVGVYEIQGGRRPYYSLVDSSPSLQRNIALYRDGTSTAVASPTMIIEWHKEDDPVSARMRDLERRSLEAEARVRPSLVTTSAGTSNGLRLGLELRNDGKNGFSVDVCEWELKWKDEFFENLDSELPAEYSPPSGSFKLDNAGVIPSGGVYKFEFRFTYQEGLTHFKEEGLTVRGFNANWARYHFRVPCEGELGTYETAEYTYSRDP